jgi:hypothetical protein
MRTLKYISKNVLWSSFEMDGGVGFSICRCLVASLPLGSETVYLSQFNTLYAWTPLSILITLGLLLRYFEPHQQFLFGVGAIGVERHRPEVRQPHCLLPDKRQL